MARSAQTARKPKAKRQAEPQQQPQGKRSKHQKKDEPKQQQKTNASAATIARLLGMDVPTFLSEYFEKKPLVVRANGSQKVRAALTSMRLSGTHVLL